MRAKNLTTVVGLQHVGTKDDVCMLPNQYPLRQNTSASPLDMITRQEGRPSRGSSFPQQASMLIDENDASRGQHPPLKWPPEVNIIKSTVLLI